ncbi:MAG TPA: hypothetical protein VMU69_20955 [Bradyrhizobium sp.]|nr:hypothetical protein [Bradyrhizobium sp.]
MNGFVNPLARKRAPRYPEAIDRLKTATREQLHLSDDTVVSVTELACREPDCPDVETIIAVLIAGEKPRTVRFHKRIIEIDLSEFAAAFRDVGSWPHNCRSSTDRTGLRREFLWPNGGSAVRLSIATPCS